MLIQCADEGVYQARAKDAETLASGANIENQIMKDPNNSQSRISLKPKRDEKLETPGANLLVFDTTKLLRAQGIPSEARCGVYCRHDFETSLGMQSSGGTAKETTTIKHDGPFPGKRGERREHRVPPQQLLTHLVLLVSVTCRIRGGTLHVHRSLLVKCLKRNKWPRTS